MIRIASESSHVLITVFGAMNTVIAGLVAYLKSRGQPMRARMYRDDMHRAAGARRPAEVVVVEAAGAQLAVEDERADGQVKDAAAEECAPPERR